MRLEGQTVKRSKSIFDAWTASVRDLWECAVSPKEFKKIPVLGSFSDEGWRFPSRIQPLRAVILIGCEFNAEFARARVFDIVRERLPRAAPPTRRQATLLDTIADLAGAVDGLPDGLSARKKRYLKATAYVGTHSVRLAFQRLCRAAAAPTIGGR